MVPRSAICLVVVFARCGAEAVHENSSVATPKSFTGSASHSLMEDAISIHNATATATAAARLPTVALYPRRHTVSGVSAGGSMAAQHAVAFSSVVYGAAVIAGSPYGCGSLGVDFDWSCNYNDPPIDVDALHRYTANRAKNGEIDPVSHLESQKYYLYIGTDDTVVYPDVMQKAQDYFQAYVPKQAMEVVFDVPSEHGDITNHYGECCNCLYGSYILNCRYDQAKAVLTQLEGPMQPKVWKAPPRNLKSISQRDYAPAGVEWWILQMLDYAYVYQPTGCTGAAVGTCKLHVLYHGCGGGGTTDGIEHVGYLEYAEANNIIIVFPQSTWGLGNLGGCWDWWGITGKDFDTKDSLQLNVVMKMINDLPNILDDAHSVTATQRRAANSNGSTESGGSFAGRNLTTASRPRPSKFSRMPNTPT